MRSFLLHTRQAHLELSFISKVENTLQTMRSGQHTFFYKKNEKVEDDAFVPTTHTRQNPLGLSFISKVQPSKHVDNSQTNDVGTTKKQ